MMEQDSAADFARRSARKQVKRDQQQACPPREQ
jgi:hypothetical protein